jgi:arylsulfatase A-like enzyme
VGRLLDQLRAAGLYDRAIVALTSDHGEGLRDHGEEEHGIFLYREAVHVR